MDAENVRILKLISGETIIAEYAPLTKDIYMLLSPMLLSINSDLNTKKQCINLGAWIPYSESSNIPIPMDHILTMVYPEKCLLEYYHEYVEYNMYNKSKKTVEELIKNSNIHFLSTATH